MESERKDKIKLVSFEKEDYIIIWNALKYKPMFHLLYPIAAVVIFLFFLLMVKDSSYALGITGVLFGIPFVGMLIGNYLSIINGFKKNAWGIGFIPPVTFVICYKFFSSVSFDKYFVIGGSIIAMIFITKWLIGIAKETLK